MNVLVVALLLSFFDLDFPDSVNIPVTNLLEADITNIYYVIPRSDTLHTASLNTPIAPDQTATIRTPYGYINKLIFQSENKNTYYTMGFPASSTPDTISISLARKEFGGIFERIYGIYPIPLQNYTDVPLKAIRSNLNESNILNGNILLPGEAVRVWVKKDFRLQITATDIQDNSTELLTFTPADPDSVQRIQPQTFYQNGTEYGFVQNSPGSWIINQITLDNITLIEAFSSTGDFLDGIDFSNEPLKLWDRVFLQHSTPMGFIVLTDINDRTYSSNIHDSLTNNYLVGDLNLDFGFAFPE